jgi:hypothetical protein
MCSDSACGVQSKQFASGPAQGVATGYNPTTTNYNPNAAPGAATPYTGPPAGAATPYMAPAGTPAYNATNPTV